MLKSRTPEYYLIRARKLSANGIENGRIVQKLQRQARKAKEQELAQSF